MCLMQARSSRRSAPKSMPEPLPRTPSFRLDGRRALVTGAGRGIGLALAAALAEAGADVTIVARSATEIEAAARAIRHEGGRAEPVTLDVRDLTAVSRFFDERPAFNVLVNNAGTNRPKPMHEVDEDDYDAVMGLNVKSAFFVAQGSVRRMLADGVSGSLIHIGSQMGHVGGKSRSLYCASKWALEGMSKAFALDLAPHGIRSNTIAPTFIDTPLTRPFFEDAAFKAGVLAKIKLGRLGRVEDLMGAALYLASDAAALVTGTSMVIDGGWTAD
jgi:NAD(P)-dependent dehydrogenase (short-subunit alcohol dehydrogenase family)